MTPIEALVEGVAFTPHARNASGYQSLTRPYTMPLKLSLGVEACGAALLAVVEKIGLAMHGIGEIKSGALVL